MNIWRHFLGALGLSLASPIAKQTLQDPIFHNINAVVMQAVVMQASLALNGAEGSRVN